MKLVCPSCNKSYNIPDSKLPTKKKKVNATCKNCSNTIVVDLTLGNDSDTTPSDKSAGDNNAASNGKTNTEKEAAAAVTVVYPELKELSSGQYEFGEVFSKTRKDSYRNKRNKYRVKLLMAVRERLEKMLGENETVHRIGKGTAYYPSEIFLGNGWLTMMYNHYVIVGTNVRLLFININSRINHPTHYAYQMAYEEIKKVTRGSIFSRIILSRKKGKRRIFNSVKRYIAKDLTLFIREKMKSADEWVESRKYLEYLCPTCFESLDKGLTECTSCRTEFKLPKTAMLKSLVLPGLGDIYLGHRFLGLLELAFSIILWIYVLSSLLAGKPEGVVMAVVILIFYNLFDALLTYHMGKKGYMPLA